MDLNTELISEDSLLRAVEYLTQGDVVAFPTETVYGLGGCLFSISAIKKIFEVKGRPSDNPLIAHVSNLEMITEIAQDIPKSFFALAEVFFPGPLTVVLPKREKVPSIACGGLSSIAIRMPSHPVAKTLIELVGAPIVAPSANRSGKPSATCYQHVLEDFQGAIPAVVVSNPCTYGIESTVVSLLQGNVQMLRPGSITQEQIEEVLKRPILSFPDGQDSIALSPGMKYRHYAPDAKVILCYSLEEIKSHIQNFPDKKRFILASQKCPDLSAPVYPLSSVELYGHLRKSDQWDYEEILVFCSKDIVKDIALMNRLQKAAGG